MGRKKTDLQYYNTFLYTRMNGSLKKQLSIKALENDMKLYEFIDNIMKKELTK